MKIAVMGAGAVGSYFGARLHQAGHAVVLIGRSSMVDAVRDAGLRLQMRGFDAHLALQASTEPAAVADAELVLFCVKSGDTEAAGAAIKPFVSRHATVLCLQNGVDNAQRLSGVLGFDAVPAVVYVALSMAAPGHVVHHGRGELIIGPSPGSARAAQAFVQAGIPTEVTHAVTNALWAKLTANCAYNALSALTQLPYGELIRRPGMQDTLRAVVAECSAVAAAAGVSLPATLWEDIHGLSRSMAGQLSSTAQDVARGRRSEIDHINGYVVRMAERHGLAAPLNRALHSLITVKDDALAAPSASAARLA